jgi:hypothetical protein
MHRSRQSVTRSRVHPKTGPPVSGDSPGPPDFVKEEFDAFLQCGILAYGFLRLRCAERRLRPLRSSSPFAASGGGFAPPAAPGGAETAAHLVDHVIPRAGAAVGALLSDPASLAVRYTSPAARAPAGGLHLPHCPRAPGGAESAELANRPDTRAATDPVRCVNEQGLAFMPRCAAPPIRGRTWPDHHRTPLSSGSAHEPTLPLGRARPRRQNTPKYSASDR